MTQLWGSKVKWIVFGVVFFAFMSSSNSETAPAEMTFVVNQVIFEGSKKTPQMRSPIMFAHQFCRKDKGFFRARAATSHTEKIARADHVRVFVDKVICTDDKKLEKSKSSFEMLSSAGYLPKVSKKPKAVVNALLATGQTATRNIASVSVASGPKAKKTVKKIDMSKKPPKKK